MLPLVPDRVSGRFWIYVLSVAALLVPAGGIAYLGAVSYRDERGAVAAQIENQRQAALQVAARIRGAIDDALATVERATVVDPTYGATALDDSLAHHWFWIGADGALRFPRAAPPVLELTGALDRAAGCPSGRLEDACVRELSTQQSRITRLHAARSAEANGNLADARRMYGTLAAFHDTGPSALLGLARVYRRMNDPVRANQALADVEKRYADRTFEGVPIRVATALLRAQASGPDALLGVADDVLGTKYALDPIIRLGVLTRIRGLLERELTADQARRRAELDETMTSIRAEARAAAGLDDDLPELVRTATEAWRGRVATREPRRTLIYRRLESGSIIGIAVDAPMLEARAETARVADVARNARPYVLATNTTPPADLRTIVEVPLDEALPHLALAIVNPFADPDPLDEVIRERSRKHVIYTSALALALGLGLLATIRGAVRARELARLKSEFVSTVSHELKTPLTSIRMFAEMLEQGVARGDATKMARYHGVIVQESQRLGLLIANLLDYSQIERGTRRYTPTRQNLGQLARDAVATFETLREPGPAGGMAARHGRNPIAIEVSSDAMQADVEVDRDVIVQAVLNLLANAAKYGGPDKPIEVHVGVSDQAHALIAVRDQGPGIPASEQARIFREFYRAPEAYRSQVEGTGLGLALVKRHVEALGGSVAVDSEVGQGATFTIRLPRLPSRGSVGSLVEVP